MPNEVNQALADLPISHLIGAPLISACEAQVQLAGAFINFVQKIGFKEDKTANLLSFDLDQPIVTQKSDGQGGTSVALETQKIHVDAPLLGLVPIPALLIENVDIDFLA